MTARWVVFPVDVPAESGTTPPRGYGGKGESLVTLTQLGLPVPEFFILPEPTLTHFFAPFYEKGESLWKKGRRGPALQKSLRPFLKEFQPAPPLLEELTQALSKFGAGSMVAVRSSALGEDGSKTSYAGIFETSLFLPADQPLKILEAIKSALLALYAERVMEYRARAKDSSVLRMALVIQLMVDAEVSGVAFSVNPTAGDPEVVLINSLYGAGEGLVGGAISGDTFIAHKLREDYSSIIADKEEQLLFDAGRGHGLKKLPLPPERRKIPSLGAREIYEVRDIAIRLEKHFGRPIDMEFCWRGGRIYLLQARPVTAIHDFPFGRKLLWDNSNIVESYSDLTLPLTFSFAQRAYKTVYTQFGRMIGVPRTIHDQMDRFMNNYLGIIQGRIYYNMATWYGSMAFLPGFGFTKGAMENMMGVREPFDFPSPPPAEGWFQRYFVELPRLVGMVGRIVWSFGRTTSLNLAFNKNFSFYYEKYRNFPFSTLTPERILDIFDELVWNVMWRWEAPIVADCTAMIFYGLLKKLVSTWNPEAHPTLCNDLLSGTGDIESREPIEELFKAGTMIQRDPLILEKVIAAEPEELFALIERDPVLAPLKTWLSGYLDKYGLRCPNELKLEEPSYLDNPTLLMKMIKDYAVQDIDLRAMREREEKTRSRAEKSMATALAGKSLLGGLLPARYLFDWVLKNARLGVRNRENLRFARTKMFGVMRRLFQGMGQAFFERGLLTEPRDIFYLKVEEIIEHIDGRALTLNLKELVNLRREDYRLFAAQAPAERFFTYGIPYHRNGFQGRGEKPPRADLKPNQIAGIGVCPGKVRGKVRLVHSPSDRLDLKGHILVARRTDPGWVPLFPISIGVLVEKGSVLSHSAIVAREMGIPAVVGIEGLFNRLKDGELVEFDGASGIITRLEEQGGETCS